MTIHIVCNMTCHLFLILKMNTVTLEYEMISFYLICKVTNVKTQITNDSFLNKRIYLIKAKLIYFHE